MIKMQGKDIAKKGAAPGAVVIVQSIMHNSTGAPKNHTSH